MQTVKLTLARLHPHQLTIKQNLRRFNVLDCGRRFGKNILDKDLAIEPMLAGYPVGWFEPTYKSLSEIWREIRSTLYPVTQDKSEQEKRIALITGGALEMWSLEDPDAGRGRKYKRVIVNEAATVKKLEYSWTNVIRATLADMKGDAVFSGTPKGLNYFYSLYQLGESDPDWARFQFSTRANPYIDPDEIEAMRRMLPERVFQQEIMAEFVEDGAFFQNVENAAVLQQPDTPEQHKGHDLFMAMDWGKSGDYSVFGVGCRQCARVVDWDRFNKIDYIYQRERAASLRARWNPGYILPERNSIGEPNIELLVNDGWPIMRGQDDKYGFYTGPTTKPAVIEALAQAFIVHGYQVPAEAKPELTVFEVNVMPSGHSQFSAPSGQHDDWVMMLALLWHAMTNTNWLIS
jgi:hypothetical protein